MMTVTQPNFQFSSSGLIQSSNVFLLHLSGPSTSLDLEEGEGKEASLDSAGPGLDLSSWVDASPLAFRVSGG